MIQRARDLIANTGAKSASISAQNTCSQCATRVPVTKSDGGIARLVVCICLGNCAYKTRAGSKCGCIEALSILHGAMLAIATVLSPNQTRELLVQRLIVKTKTLQCARAKRSKEDICRLKKVIHNFQTLRALAVDCGPFLVEGTAIICHVVKLGAESHAPSQALSTLLIARKRLNLNNRSTHFSKGSTCGRASCILGKLNYFNSLQSCHWILLTIKYAFRHIEILRKRVPAPWCQHPF